MKIGMKAPTIRIPCIFKGQFSFLSLSDFQEKGLALICLSDLTETHAYFLESQGREFEQSESTLAIMVSTDTVLGQGWTRPPQDFSLPFFIDPICRLQKMFHLTPSLRLNRCETLIFDQGHRLRFRLIHDLNLIGVSAALDIVKSDFLRSSPTYVSKPTVGHRPHPQITDSQTAIEHMSHTIG